LRAGELRAGPTGPGSAPAGAAAHEVRLPNRKVAARCAKDPKSRLRSTIKLAEDRLVRAESLTTQKAYEEASIELGGYLGLIGDLRAFILTLEHDKGSTRDMYKHLEIGVRLHISRLAVMRRSTPASYAVHFKDAEDYIKDTRAEALDSFYGHSVLRESAPEKSPAPKASPDAIKRP
jgi:hypothetical protein